MNSKILVKKWFDKWEEGDFLNLPISETFKHRSPYGTIDGKQEYISLVETNKDKFLGHHFEIHDWLYEEHKACIRSTAFKEDFTLNVSEWHYIRENQITEIVAYYNREGDISAEKQLSKPLTK